MKNEIEKLRALQKRILYTRDNKEKYFLLRDYYHLYYFLQTIKQEIPNDIDNLANFEKMFDGRCRQEQQISIDIIDKNMDRLKDISEEIIKLYHQNNFYSYTNTKYFGVDYRKMSEIMGSFFWNIGDDVLSLYQKMLREKRIKRYDLSNMEGGSLSTMYTDLAYIVLDDKDDNLNFYSNLAHELGHVYEWSLEKNKLMYIYDVHLFSEVVSITFEKLFMLYLDLNNLLKDANFKRQHDFHSSLLNRFAVCKLLCILKKEGKLSSFVGDDYEVFSALSKEVIKNQLEKDCGMVYDASKELNLEHFMYIIGDIISSYFYYQIWEDYEKGIEELKNFVREDRLKSSDMIFNKYLSDLSYHKRYIKEFMEKRKY